MISQSPSNGMIEQGHASHRHSISDVIV